MPMTATSTSKAKVAGQHAMESMTEYLEKKRLKLRVNRDKSAVARPWQRKFLGYSRHVAQAGASEDRW
jgi:retron-type reverse transcriptase